MGRFWFIYAGTGQQNEDRSEWNVYTEIESRIENLHGKGINMEKEHDALKEWEDGLEQVKDGLLDVLSLVILLENDMESQKSDGVYVRILKIIHHSINDTQKKLSMVERRTEE